MPRRSLLALALLAALTGCVSAPPDGAFVEYHAGLTPITRPVKCPGTYALRACDGSPAEPLLIREASEGERIGFRREADGSVTAMTREQALPLPPGAYAWELVPGTNPPWADRFRAKVGAGVGHTVQATGNALGAVGMIVIAVGGAIIYALASAGGR